MAEPQKRYRLSSVLKALAKDKRTGTLICLGEDNVQGRIFLRDGHATSARCRNFHGQEAINRINQHPLVSLKFYRNENFVTLDNGTSPGKPLKADISSLARLADDAQLQTQLTPETKTMIAEELTEYLGPLADLFVSELQPGISLARALKNLATDIGDIDASIEFINKVKERL